MRSGAAHVAGAVRARALARRCVGPAAARVLAGSPGLDAAIAALASTPYGRDVRSGQDAGAVQEAVATTLVWRLRVLAGWLPSAGVQRLRAIAGWFEIRNVERLLRQQRGRAGPAPFQLGALAVAWPRLSGTSTADQVRAVLASSAWGDPGAATAHAIVLGMRTSWALRAAAVPAAQSWAAGGLALWVAREHWVTGQAFSDTARARAAGLLGRRAVEAPSFAAFVAALPARAAWAFDGVAEPGDLWRAEAAWWARLDHDAHALLRSPGFDDRPAIGAAAALAVDAWRVRAAVAGAADGTGAAPFDAVINAGLGKRAAG
ncbi:hypothetical protein Drose_18925 [Dactylosporangium roseum]|uniref:Uncharacterized protein n=1 Tax=Dactylosporangium roseum TaxID=47989 RepID=A0ABY5ZF86_9ACTN|nr:hypothetical protein [Dactylosporangium roseum]UWZ40087.1 hypothetical protein Drose_18925 [Dactylosporangium roseum]